MEPLTFACVFFYYRQYLLLLLIISMKPKPIINQLNFKKVAKSQLFVIRDKAHPLPHTPSNLQISLSRQTNNIEPADVMRINLQECIQQLERQIQQQTIMKDDVSCKIKKYLLQFMNNLPNGLTAVSKKIEEKHQIYPNQPIPSMAIPQPQLESTDECRNREINFSKDKESNALEGRKNNLAKFRCNKQNYEHVQSKIVVLEDKIKEMGIELERYRMDHEKQKEKIEGLQTKLEDEAKEREAIACKLEETTRQNEQERRDYKEEYDTKCQALTSIFQDRGSITAQLNERQTQIVNLWQLFLRQ